MIRRYNENKKNHIKHCSEFVVAFNSCSCKNIRIQIATVFQPAIMDDITGDVLTGINLKMLI